jgi:CubicO group peptidase (beta-lactamase class C family)
MPGDKEKIIWRVETAIRDKVFPGCVIGVSQNGTREIFPLGTLIYHSNEKVTPNTVYDLASITKSIPTASLVAMFVLEGKMRLDDQVKKYIPEMVNDFGATIEDLLLYRAKGPRMSTLGFRTFEQIRSHLLETGFVAAPGEPEYTNMPAYVLGIVLERISEKSIAVLAHEYFFEPLQMGSTTFFPTASDCAPTEIQNGVVVQGIVHDESARLFAKARRTVGHAGLFSTVPDLLSFLEALLKSGLTKSRFSAVIEGAEYGLGWARAEPWFAGTHVSKKAFGKTGFTGTSVLVDRETGIALVILSNRTYPTRPPDAASLASAVNIFRRDIADIVFA